MAIKPLPSFVGRARTQPDWIIPGLLKRHNTAFLIGQPKEALKSWLLLNLAWDLADGVSLWGVTHQRTGPMFVPPKPMRVVYFTQEDAEDDIQDRIELMVNGGRSPQSNVLISPKDLKLMLSTSEGCQAIQRELDDVMPFDLVLFDPMRRMHNWDENDSSKMAELWRVLDVIHRRYNCASIFSHHIIKPPTAKGSKFNLASPFAARGSGDIYGGGDAFINVVPTWKSGQTGRRPGTSRSLVLHLQTKRGQPLDPIKLNVDLTQGKVAFAGFA